MKSAEDIRSVVADRYARIAEEGSSCCGPECCGEDASAQAKSIGYTETELVQAEQAADISLGCGTPVQFAELTSGERALDLGSGGGIDVFLAARAVGDTGQIIGVDMTPQMIERARANAAKMEVGNVEFRQGLIEELPVDDGSIDVVLSNCVINLAPDKGAVFAEAFRVLAPGGRLVVSDLVAATAVARPIDPDPEGWASCIDGAIPEAEYLGGLEAAGFVDVGVLSGGPGPEAEVYSVTVRAVKPS